MTNVKLCRDGQRCSNSVNYWVTLVQARLGRGQWSGHWWGLARGWHRPMGWPEWGDGWAERSWLVRLVAGWLRQRLCNPAAVSCVSCGGPSLPSLSHTQSLTREIPSPGPGDIGRCQTGRSAANGRCWEWQWPGPGLSSQERMVVRAESCANSQNITVWSECQHQGHNPENFANFTRSHCCTWSDTSHQPQVVSSLTSRGPLSLSSCQSEQLTSVHSECCHDLESSDMWGCRGAPPSLSSVLRPPGVGQVSR